MQRRSFLLETTALIVGLAGCATDVGEPPGGTETRTGPLTETPPTPELGPPDCVDPERPEPNDGSGNVEPATYPEKPRSLENTDEVAHYIESYEEAYRTNSLLDRHSDSLEEIQLGVGEPQFFDSRPGSTIARLEYTYGFEFDSGVADSPTIYASYYVDDSVVVRAEHEGVLDDEDELKPDPLTDGDVLECFG